MELRLILMRHAKSDWSSGATSDHARPLNKRGRRDAPRIGERLHDLGWWPELALVSSAKRTQQTWKYMQAHVGKSAELLVLDRLYHAGPRELSECLVTLDDTARVVLALGHNPGWQQAVYHFSANCVDMKTACAAMLSLETDGWHRAGHASGAWTLVNFVCPKDEATDEEAP